MREFDNIELTEEVPELAEKGIHKEYLGLIVELHGDVATVCFFNPHYHGERAFVKTDIKYLAFVLRAEEELIEELKEWYATVDTSKFTRLREQDVKEYDKIQLLVEKPEYAKEGVHKGMIGCVLIPYAIDNRWDIQFVDNWVELCVDRDDFCVLE